MNIYRNLRQGFMALCAATALAATAADGYTATPAPDSVLPEGFDGILFAFDDASKVSLDLNKASFVNSDNLDEYALRTLTQGFKPGEIFVYFDDYDWFDIDGKYLFTAEEGAFTVDGNPYNEAIEIHYTIDSAQQQTQDSVTLTVTPAPGSTLQELRTFTVTFSISDWSIRDSSMIWVTDNKDNYYPCTAREVEGFGDNYMQVTLATPITEPGEYELGIGYQALNFRGVASESIYSFKYKVAIPGVWNGEYRVEPEPGRVESLHDILVIFGEGNRLYSPDQLSPKDYPTLYTYSEKSGIGVEVEKAMVLVQSDTLSISLYSTITGGGGYALVIPKQLFTINGDYMEEDMQLIYTVGEESQEFEYTYTFDPADGAEIEHFTSITTTFQGVGRIERDIYAWKVPVLYRVDEEGNILDYYRGLMDDVSSTSFIFMLSEYYQVEETGLYKYVVPAGYITVFKDEDSTSGIKVPEIVSYFTFKKSSGIEAVAAPSQKPSPVYNAAGVKVLDEPGQVDALAPGIYIVNGKKVMVK